MLVAAHLAIHTQDHVAGRPLGEPAGKRRCRPRTRLRRTNARLDHQQDPKTEIGTPDRSAKSVSVGADVTRRLLVLNTHLVAALATVHDAVQQRLAVTRNTARLVAVVLRRVVAFASFALPIVREPLLLAVQTRSSARPHTPKHGSCREPVNQQRI